MTQMTRDTDDRPTYWLPWWWDHPESVPVDPIDPTDLGMPAPTPAVAEPASPSPTATDLGGGFGGGPPPAAAAAAQLTRQEIDRLHKIKQRSVDRHTR